MRAGPFTLMLALGIMTAPALAEEESLPDQIVDALNKADGAFPGYRATHAKGLVAEGNFKPTREAAELSKASLLQGPTVPATFRFASGSGIPTIADGSPRANPHALAIKYHLADGGEADMALNSRKFFPVATGEEFRDLMLAAAASPPGAPKPTALEKFKAEHPLAAIPLQRPQASRKSSITASTRLSSRTSRATNKLFATSRFRPRSPISQRMKRPSSNRISSLTRSARVSRRRQSLLSSKSNLQTPVTQSLMRQRPGRRNARP